MKFPSLLALVGLVSADANGYTTEDIFKLSIQMSSGFFEGFNMYQIANAVNTTYQFHYMDNTLPDNFDLH